MNPTILLHGALGSEKQMGPLLPLFERSGPAYAFDFTGHGSRTGLEVELTFDLFAQDIRKFLDDHDIQAANLFGYSMGGYAALHFADLFPDRVRSIVTLGTKYVWDPETTKKEVAMLNPEKIKEKVPKFAKLLADRHGEEDWERLLDQTKVMMLGISENPPLSEEILQRVQHPVMLMVGDRDTTAGVEDTVSTYRNIPESQLTVLPGTPHPVERARKDWIYECCRVFLKGLEE